MAVVYTAHIRRAWYVSPDYTSRYKAANQTRLVSFKPRPLHLRVLATSTRPNSLHCSTVSGDISQTNSRTETEHSSSHSVPVYATTLHNRQHVFPPTHIHPRPPKAVYHLGTSSQCHLHPRCGSSTYGIHSWSERCTKTWKSSTMVSPLASRHLDRC